jgi:hypothetical protein
MALCLPIQRQPLTRSLLLPTESTIPHPKALLHPQVPETPTDDLTLPVEELRDAALPSW